MLIDEAGLSSHSRHSRQQVNNVNNEVLGLPGPPRTLKDVMGHGLIPRSIKDNIGGKGDYVCIHMCITV